MSDEFTLTTGQIKELCLLGAIDAAGGEHNLYMFETVSMINRWLTAHDAATRTAALEEAAVIAESEVLRQTYSVKKEIAAAIRAAKEGE